MDEQLPNDSQEYSGTGTRRHGAEAYAEARSIPFAKLIRLSVCGSLMAGGVMLTYQLLISATADPLEPLREYSSLVLGEQAAACSPIRDCIAWGLMNTVSVSLFWGLVLAMLLAAGRFEWMPGQLVSLGMVFGAIVWLTDFHAFAPLFWPWLEKESSVVVILGHVFCYGLPLGAWIASKTSRE